MRLRAESKPFYQIVLEGGLRAWMDGLGLGGWMDGL
jgi:hypothetical protein